MRYPHQVRLIDVRNRQPSQGAAYDAVKYDLLKIVSENAAIPGNISDTDDIVDYLNANHVEPAGAEPVTFDVDAFVTASDDGDRNLDTARLNIRIPTAEVDKARSFFMEQRKRSLSKFGYTIERSNIVIFSLTTGPAISRSIDSAIGSSVIYENIDVENISMAPIGDKSGILSGLVNNAHANWSVSLVDRSPYTGLFPPVQGWVKATSSKNTPGYRYNVSAELGPGYPWNLQLSRVDRYRDNFSFRANIPFVDL